MRTKIKILEPLEIGLRPAKFQIELPRVVQRLLADVNFLEPKTKSRLLLGEEIFFQNCVEHLWIRNEF